LWSILESELSVKMFSRYHKSSMSFFSRVEHSKMFNLTTDLNVRIPIHGSLIQVRPFEAGLTSFSLGIEAVLRSRAEPQISWSVIAPITIFMV